MPVRRLIKIWYSSENSRLDIWFAPDMVGAAWNLYVQGWHVLIKLKPVQRNIEKYCKQYEYCYS